MKVLHTTFTPEEEEQFKKYHTQNLQAVIYLGQGLDALDAGHWQNARMFFKKAKEEDPEFKLAEYYLDHCPAATVASLNTIAAMTVGQLSHSVEAAVAEASDARADEGQKQESDPSGKQPDTTGSISIEW